MKRTERDVVIQRLKAELRESLDKASAALGDKDLTHSIGVSAVESWRVRNVLTGPRVVRPRFVDGSAAPLLAGGEVDDGAP